MIEEIQNIPIGKILVYYNFYELESSNSHYFFRNSLGFDIIIFLPQAKEQFNYFLPDKLTSVNKVDLFTLLLQVNHSTLDNVINVIEEIQEIQDFPEVNIAKRRTKEFFLQQIFSLIPEDQNTFKLMNQNLFTRNGEAAVILFKDNNPIDVLCSTKGSSYTVFETNQGIFIKPGDENLLITYCPDSIKKELNKFQSNSILFIPELLSNYDMMQLPLNNYKKLYFFSNTIKEYYFCLNIICSICKEKITLQDIKKNTCFEIRFYFDSSQSNLKILKYNATIQNKFIKKIPSELLKNQTLFIPSFKIEEIKQYKILCLKVNYTKFSIKTFIEYFINSNDLNVELIKS